MSAILRSLFILSYKLTLTDLPITEAIMTTEAMKTWGSASSGYHFKLDTTFTNEETDSEEQD